MGDRWRGDDGVRGLLGGEGGGGKRGNDGGIGEVAVRSRGGKSREWRGGREMECSLRHLQASAQMRPAFEGLRTPLRAALMVSCKSFLVW